MNLDFPLVIETQTSAMADEVYCPECGKPFCELSRDDSRQPTPVPTGPVLLTVIGILLIAIFGWRAITSEQTLVGIRERLAEPSACSIDDRTGARCTAIYSRRAGAVVQSSDTASERSVDQSLIVVVVGAAAVLVGIGETFRRRYLEKSTLGTAWCICDRWLGSIFRVLLILLGLAVSAQLLRGDVGLWSVLDGAMGHLSDALLKGGSLLVG